MKLRNIILIVLMSMMGIPASAHDIEATNADGVTIYYKWMKRKTELAVIFQGNGYWEGESYSGNVVIPESVNYNGNPYPVTSIYRNAFRDCSSLTNVTIPNSITSIDTDAFNGCFGLTSINIPNSVTYITSHTFMDCSGLTSIDIPNSVTNIGQSAFSGCSGLTSVTIPNSVTGIERNTFEGCSGLTSIDIPNSVTSIGDCAFKGCSGLTSIDIPNSVTSIDNRAFSNCSDLKRISVESGNEKYDSPNNCNAIIETVSNSLIRGCVNTIIPNYVVSIGDYAFSGCSGLTNIDIPNSVTSIGDRAFFGCSGLTSLDIPNSITTIGSDAFSGCSGLTSLNIPNSITTIGGGAFSGCSGLTNVTIGNSVTSIGNSAFYECNSLTGVIISDITHWCGISFLNGYSNPLSYAKHLFIDGEEVKDVVIPGSVTCIGNNAFYGGENITSVTIPNSVTSIGEWAFAYCSAMTSITIGNSVTSIGVDAFMNCYALTSVIIPNSVTTISDYAFFCCYGLNSLAIGNSVSSIGESAFWGCELTSVTMEKATPVVISNETFNNRANATLYVPFGSKAAYEAADYWKEFKEIVELGLEPLDEEVNVDFADAEVKRICVENWDTNGDQELSQSEAAAVKDIGAVFKGNRTIKSFEELEHFTGITTIPEQAFFGCSELETVTIPNQVKGIGNNAFSSTKLKSIYIPASVTEQISHTPFYDCPELASIIVDEDNPTFDSRDNCNAIIETATNKLIAGCKKTVIPNGVTTIAQHALACATGLTQIDIPQSVTTIEYEAFSATGLESIVIPSSVSNLDFNNPFSRCANLKSIVVEADNPWYDSRDNCNAIIESSTNKLVSGCQNTIIPESVTSIGMSAFDYCKSLKSISLPDCLEKIEYRAFCNTAITLIDIPRSVNSIGKHAFLWCFNLHSVVVHWAEPIAITEDVFPDRAYATLYVPVGSKAAYEAADYWKDFQKIVEKDEEATPNSPIVFADAEVKRICIENWDTNEDGELSYGEAAAVTDLDGKFTANETIVTFDELQYFTGLTSMGYDFGHCYELQSVIVPKNVTSMGAHTFKWCMKLSHLELPEALVDIKDFALHGCKSLTEITIPKNVRYIRDWAFQNCSSITSLEIPEKVELVGTYIVSACPLLTTLTVNSANPYYDSRDNCNAIIHTESNTLVASCQTTTIPNSVKAIGDYAFCFCMGLKRIDIPSGVESIGVNAFKDAEFSSIDIPASVTSIGDEAFFCCNSLTSVTVRMEQPIAITENTFSNRANATLYVPFGCKEAYEKADYWKEFKEIVEMGISPLYEDDNVDFSDTDNEINEETDLTDTVVNNLYYSIGTDAGGYNAQDGCIVITKETSEEQMTALEGLGISDEELKQNFTGIIFKVPAGRGYVTVTAETTGNMTLKVQVGNGMPMEMVLSGRLTMKVPYNVEEETMVYIFAGTQSAARGLLRGAPDQSVKIYGIELETTVVKGDANEDKKVNDADVNEVANAIVGKPSDNYNKTIADMDNDGDVDITDLTRIVKIAKSRR